MAAEVRVVVTGAGGFVGRALIAALARAHEVTGIDTAAVPSGCRALRGDLADPDLLDTAFAEHADAVIHLATVPGGAAEEDPAEAKRVNLDATMALIDAAARSGKAPRFIFASSVAVFGDPLPPQVDDTTPLAPRLLYGAHKAMAETWIATQTRRGAIKGLSLRLPGIVARPAGSTALKSAFLSDIFHALAAHRPFTVPVSRTATMWLMSRARLVDNLIHALALDGGGRAVTLPALRVRMDELVQAIAITTGSDPALVDYAPDPLLEAAFGAQPALATPAAAALGFAHDTNIQRLVARALAEREDA